MKMRNPEGVQVFWIGSLPPILRRNRKAAVQQQGTPHALRLCLQPDGGIGISFVARLANSQKDDLHFMTPSISILRTHSRGQNRKKEPEALKASGEYRIIGIRTPWKKRVEKKRGDG
jgi:hypothetical protein